MGGIEWWLSWYSGGRQSVLSDEVAFRTSRHPHRRRHIRLRGSQLCRHGGVEG